MTQIHDLYQDFSPPGSLFPSGAKSAKPKETSEEVLASFENGYQSGWDDAVEAQRNMQVALSEDLVTKLQDAKFEFNEMRSEVQKLVQDMVSGILDSTFSGLGQQKLRSFVCREVERLVSESLNGEIAIVVSPSDLNAVEGALAQVTDRFSVQADPDMEKSKAIFRYEQREYLTDPFHEFSEISKAVSDFFETQKVEALS